MIGELVEFFIFEWANVLKSIIGVCIVVGLILVVGINGWNAFVSYDHSIQPHVVTPVPIQINQNGQPIVTIAPTSQPTDQTQIITVDCAALKPNYQYPAQFSRDVNTDPIGAYFADLNFGNGMFPGVYIVPSQWEKSGGRIVVVSQMPTTSIYYTVFTNTGSSSQVIYDREKNIIYSMVQNPMVDGTQLGEQTPLFSGG
jgi:hypothetical protein